MKTDLKANIIPALETLGQGILQCLRGRPNIGTSPMQIHQASLVLMYRLLILHHTGRSELRPQEAACLHSIELWDNLQKQFMRLHALGAGPWFDPAAQPLLAQIKLPDDILTRSTALLRQSACWSAGAGVRSLGDTYELLLDYSPRLQWKSRHPGGMAASSRPCLGTKATSRRVDSATHESPAGRYALVREMDNSRRMAGGSYYTPDSIIQYMVECTLGSLVRGECRPPANVSGKPLFATPGGMASSSRPCLGPGNTDMASKTPLSIREILNLKILDPAMGAGYFLLAAADYLAQACVAASKRDGKSRRTKKDFSHYRRLVVERCLYGVDRDSNAVELATLSLKLAVRQSGRPFVSLDHHLKCGDSLIGSRESNRTVKPGHQSSSPPPFVRPFHWDREFPEVFTGDTGGFDAILGNPPYLGARARAAHEPAAVSKFLTDTYKTAIKGFDLYVPFFERSVQLVRPKGLVCLIVPNKLWTAEYGRELVRCLTEENTLIHIADVSSAGIFDGVGAYPFVVTVAAGSSGPDYSFTQAGPFSERSNVVFGRDCSVRRLRNFLENPARDQAYAAAGKMSTLKALADVTAGVTGFTARAIGDCLCDGKPGRPAFSFIVTGSIDPFCIFPGRLRYMKHIYQDPWLAADAPALTPGKRALFKARKIVVAGLATRIEAACDDRGRACGVNVYCIHNAKVPLMYLLGILNSAPATQFYRARFNTKHLAGGYLAINKSQLEQIPIPHYTTLGTDRQEQQAKKLAQGYLADKSLALASQGDSAVGRRAICLLIEYVAAECHHAGSDTAHQDILDQAAQALYRKK